VSEIEELRAEVAELRAAVEMLRAENAELKARLGLDSSNSSKPPSSDGYKKPTRQQRRDEERKVRKAGKQPGARGHRLAPVDNPDEIFIHEPTECHDCGSSLRDGEIVDTEVRQVFDVPPPRVIVREHRARRRRCRCGKTTKALFPAEAINVTCYGPQVRALAVYLVCGHHLPFDRAAQVLSDICGLSVSPGSIVNMVHDAAAGLTDFAVAVREALRNEKVVHFDETGARTAGKLFWVHSASTELLTAYLVHENRGTKAIDEMGIIALHDENGEVIWTFDGITVHDGWYAYRSYEVIHQLCNAHHLRELKAVAELLDQQWAAEMIDLLRTAKQAIDEAKTNKRRALRADVYLQIVSIYSQLITKGFKANPRQDSRAQSKAHNLLLRLSEHRDDVLRFTTDFDIPFDNNQAERDIRMVKLQQKISGCWRNPKGAKNFLRVREYLSTARKHSHAAFDVLIDLFTGNCWMPGEARV
jgi:transposase